MMVSGFCLVPFWYSHTHCTDMNESGWRVLPVKFDRLSHSF